MKVSRRPMKFLLPITISDLGKTDVGNRIIIPMYISPQSFSIQEAKIVQQNLTKGGYVIQHWGEELPIIQADGSTGSGGIEAVNILRDVYRHEQLQFSKLLLKRAKEMTDEYGRTLDDTPISSTGDLFGGFFDDIGRGVKSIIETISDAANGTSSITASTEFIPTLGAYAVSMLLFWQGEKFRGYFKDFKVSESADKPGLFDYSFSFIVTKRIGKRKNFMPWHRSPYDGAGNPIGVSLPKEGQRLDELSFKSSSSTQSGIIRTKTINSTFNETQESVNPKKNRVNINRNKFIKGN